MTKKLSSAKGSIVTEQVSKVRSEGEKIKKQIHERSVGYIVSAMGFVAGLAWNDAIKSTIEALVPLKENTVWAKLLYALIVTGVIAFVSAYLLRPPKEQE